MAGKVITVDTNVLGEAASNVKRVSEGFSEQAGVLRNLSSTLTDSVKCRGSEQLFEAFEKIAGNVNTLARGTGKITTKLERTKEKALAIEEENINLGK